MEASAFVIASVFTLEIYALMTPGKVIKFLGQRWASNVDGGRRFSVPRNKLPTRVGKCEWRWTFLLTE